MGDARGVAMRQQLVAVAVFTAGLTLGGYLKFVGDAEAVGFVVPDAGVVDTGGYPRWGADISVSVSTTSTTSGLAALTKGVYTLTCDVASNADVGASGVTATTSDRRIPADYPYPVLIDSERIMAIRGTASGTCVLSLDSYR